MAKNSSKDSFTTDKCGLFYNILPDKTYTVKGATSKGTNVNKERITVLASMNLDGKMKFPLLAISK
jgi:hypothetical protein